MTAVARVEQRIVITGVDRASDAVKQAKASMTSLDLSAQKAQRSIKRSSDHAKGAFAHGLPGLEGKHDSFNRLAAAAGGAGGALQASAHDIALLDAAMRLIPGPVGAAAAVIGGATALLYQHAVAVRRVRERYKQAFGAESVQSLERFAGKLRINAESMIEVAKAAQESGIPLQDIREKLKQVVANAEAVGDDGGAAIKRFAATLKATITPARRLALEIASLNLGATAREEFAQFKAAALDVDLPPALRSEAVAKAKEAMAAYKQLAALEKTGLDVTAARTALTRDLSIVQQTLVRAANENLRNKRLEAREEIAAANRFNAEIKRNKQRAAAQKAQAAAAKRRAAAQKTAAFGVRQALEGAKALLDYQRQDLATEELIAQARRATAAGTEAKVRAEQKLIAAQTAQKVLDAQNSDLDAADKAKRVEAIEAIARAERTARVKAIRDSGAAERKAAAEEKKRQKEEAEAKFEKAVQPFIDAAGAISRSAQAAGSTGLAQLTASVQIAAAAALDLKKNFEDIPAAAQTVAGAVGGIGSIAIDADTARTQKALEADKQRQLSTATSEAERARITEEFEARKATAVEDGERRKAGILGLMEIAKGVATAFVNPVESASHFAGAALYGAVAGGAFSGGGATGATGGGGGFAETTTGTGGGGASSAGPGVTIVNNFNQPLTTRHHIGKSVQGALKSIGGTGHAKSRGA